MSRGAVIIALGEKARRESARCVASLREHCPDLDICIIGDRPTIKSVQWIDIAAAASPTDRIVQSRSIKVDLFHHTSFDSTLYLDADTRLLQDASTLFDILESGFDMLISPSSNQDSDAFFHVSEQERAETRALYADHVPLQLQAGVLCFRLSHSVRLFFGAWRAEWEKYRGADQAALVRALHRAPLRLALISKLFNQPVNDTRRLSETVIRHHFGAAR